MPFARCFCHRHPNCAPKPHIPKTAREKQPPFATYSLVLSRVFEDEGPPHIPRQGLVIGARIDAQAAMSAPRLSAPDRRRTRWPASNSDWPWNPHLFHPLQRSPKLNSTPPPSSLNPHLKHLKQTPQPPLLDPQTARPSFDCSRAAAAAPCADRPVWQPLASEHTLVFFWGGCLEGSRVCRCL